MHRSAQLGSLPEAIKYINQMNPEGHWNIEMDRAVSNAVAKVLQERMA